MSSTFADLSAERAALHASVFPDLRVLCAGLGAQFHAIDLRWGVDGEAALDQRAVPICLDEVDRCVERTRQPYFLLLLGERYGWRPLPATVGSADLQAYRGAMHEDDAALVDLWYVEDRNAVPAVHVLQPRRGRYVDDRVWQPVEGALHAALRRAAVASSDGDAFTASVTELEVRRALGPPDRAAGAVHAFFRGIVDPPPDAEPYVECRDGLRDPGAAQALADLRKAVRDATAPGCVHRYMAPWDDRRSAPTTDHVATLCHDVRVGLEATIRAELAERETIPVWQREDRDHEAFGQERTGRFVGREALLARLSELLAGPPAGPVLLTGAAGSGKTAVMAELARRVRAAGAPAVVRYVGATPRSAEVRTLMQDLTAALRHARNAGYADPPLTTDAAVAAFRAELDRPRPDGRTVLLVDGLDQLAGTPPDLAWLPVEAPKGAQLVVSAQAGPVADSVGRYLETTPVALEPLTAQEGGDLLDAWLADAGRTLQAHQRAEVLRAFDVHGLPLHLRLAVAAALPWTSSSVVAPGSLADDMPGLVEQLVERLRREHGDVLVVAALAYLAAARNGLTEDEELDLLSTRPDVVAEVAARFPKSPSIGGRIPPVLWARLLSDLRPYLAQREADGRVVLGFFHRQVGDEVRTRHLAGAAGRARHAELAACFAEQPLALGTAGDSAPNLRKLSELPYQQTRAGRWDELVETLTDFRFLEAKARWSDTVTGADETGRPVATHGGVYALQDDVELALTSWPEAVPGRALLSVFGRALAIESDVLAARPDLTWPHLANRLRGSASAAVASEALRRSTEGEVWLRLRTRFTESAALVRRLAPRTDALSSCALGRDDAIAVSTDMDGTVHVWNTANGRVVRVLRDAGQSVACAVSPDGRYAVAADGGGVVHVWRIEDGRQVARVTAHDGPANACQVLPGGDSLVTFGTDGVVRRWTLPDLRPEGDVVRDAGTLTFGVASGDGSMLAFGSRRDDRGVVWLRGSDGSLPDGGDLEVGTPVLSCAFGRSPAVLLTGLADGRLALWDLATRQVRTVAAHEGEVLDCAVTADGALAASAGDDATLRLWRLPDLSPVATLHAHQFLVSGCAFGADGGLLLSVGGEGAACLWDVAAAAEAADGGHTELVWSCGFTSDGAALLTASADGTVRRWAVSDGREAGPPVRHPGVVALLARHRDRWVVAAGDAGVVQVVPETPTSATTSDDAGLVLGRQGSQVWGLAITAGGATAVTAGLDGTCRAWPLEPGGHRAVFAGDGLPLRCCDADSTGSRVTVAGDAGVVHLWDVVDGSVIDLEGHEAPVWAVAAHPGGRVAAGAKDGAVRVWTAGSARLLGREADSVEHLLWLGPDCLVTGAVDGSIAVWRLDGRADDGVPLRWAAHRGPVRGLVAGPSGQVLVSVGADGGLSAWHRDGRPMASIMFPGQLRALAAHPTAPLVGVGGDAGLVHIAEIVGLRETW